MIRLWLAILLCVLTGGCANGTLFGNLQPRQVDIWSDPIFAQEKARLTYNSEVLSRVEPFVGKTEADLYVVLRPETDIFPTALNNDPGDLLTYTIMTRGEGNTADPGVFALDSSTYNLLLKDYLGDRVIQVNRLCDAYFRRLDGIAGGADFGQSALNTIGDYSSVIMGLTGSPAKALAVLAGTQAALNETVDAATVLLLLSPAPSTVRGLVDARQRRLLSEANSDVLRRPTHQNIESLVQSYALACTPVGIRAIINDAVTERTRAEDPDRTTIAGQSLLAGLESVLNNDATTVNRVGTLNEDAAAHLLWLSRTPDCAAATCAVRQVVTARAPSLVAAYDRNRETVVAKLAELAVAEPSVGARASALETAFLDAAERRRQADRDEENARLKQENDALRLRLQAPAAGTPMPGATAEETPTPETPATEAPAAETSTPGAPVVDVPTPEDEEDEETPEAA
ncbi:hypothetical protein [Brevundimonas sp.]|uniref:hypothetical protein n=1 Tax=Brevundimonas sp. TaxID=1871086 RepID=UPI0011F96A41|nr:hypothetical protein [Brevundimonas sp.]TAJ65401.1 MAG: hypothetical protein EPO49_03155 [Brevundimonas sp.]